MSKKTRIASAELKVLCNRLIAMMQAGDFGSLPSGRGKSNTNISGGFYKLVGDYALAKFGHRPGQGTLRKCVIAAQGATSASAPAQTRPTFTRISASTPANNNYRLMLRRLSSNAANDMLTVGQRAFVASLKAGYVVKKQAGYSESKRLTPKEKSAIVRLYGKVFDR